MISLEAAKTYFTDEAQKIIARLENDMTSVNFEEVSEIRGELMRLWSKLDSRSFDFVADLVIKRVNQMSAGLQTTVINNNVNV